MRSKVAAAATALVAVVLVGCGSGTVAPPGPERAGGAPPDETAAPAVASPALTFVRTVDEEDPAYRFEASLPVATGVPAAAAVERQVRAWYDRERESFVREEAAFNPPGQRLDGLPPGWLEVEGEAGAVTPSLLSLVLHVSTMHQGAAHPWHVVETFTFDAATGERLELAELFAPGAPVLETISAEVVPVLVARLDPTGDGSAEAGVREGAGPDAALLRRFVVEEAGLTLHFDQYQVAPGAAGPQAVTLAWDRLLALLPPSPRLAAALAALA